LANQGVALQSIPKAVAASLEKNQIPKAAISISVLEIEPGRPGKVIAKTALDWRSEQAMNPASTMKLVTTHTGLDILGPQ
jgi:D-alanyl-D-alanine carboxypeptidase/D-alanyl-D-alanine-endopeptidase (penicillin-binding protein 4)